MICPYSKGLLAFPDVNSRTMTVLQSSVDMEETIKVQELNIFMGNKDYIANELKKNLVKVQGSDELIVSLCNSCVGILESSPITFQQKTRVLKVIDMQKYV